MDEQRTDAPPGWDDFVRENGERARAGAGPGQRGAIPDFTPLIAIVEALLTLRALID